MWSEPANVYHSIEIHVSEALYDSVFVSEVVGDSISIFCYLS